MSCSVSVVILNEQVIQCVVGVYTEAIVFLISRPRLNTTTKDSSTTCAHRWLDSGERGALWCKKSPENTN